MTPPSSPGPSGPGEQLMEIAGIRLDVPSSQPVVILREAHGRRHVPIWVGTNEATSIVFATQGIAAPRPLTHDLLLQACEAFGRTLAQVRVHTVQDTVFHAALVFDDGTVIDSRASDAIALAARVECPILCADPVLEAAGMILTGDGELREPEDHDRETEEPQAAEEAVQRFRDFLDSVDPEDFQR